MARGMGDSGIIVNHFMESDVAEMLCLPTDRTPHQLVMVLNSYVNRSGDPVHACTRDRFVILRRTDFQLPKKRLSAYKPEELERLWSSSSVPILVCSRGMHTRNLQTDSTEDTGAIPPEAIESIQTVKGRQVVILRDGDEGVDAWEALRTLLEENNQDN